MYSWLVAMEGNGQSPEAREAIKQCGNERLFLSYVGMHGSV